MTWAEMGAALAEVLPKLRTRIQLTGVVVAIAAMLIVQLVTPGNVKAILAAGAIGISFLIFGQLFHFLTAFRPKDRPTVFLGAFAMFIVLVLSMTALAAYFVATAAPEVTSSNAALRADLLSASQLSDLGLKQAESGGLTYEALRVGREFRVSHSAPLVHQRMDPFDNGMLDFGARPWNFPYLRLNAFGGEGLSPLELVSIELEVVKVEPVDEPIPEVRDAFLTSGTAKLTLTNVGWRSVADARVAIQIGSADVSAANLAKARLEYDLGNLEPAQQIDVSPLIGLAKRRTQPLSGTEGDGGGPLPPNDMPYVEFAGELVFNGLDRQKTLQFASRVWLFDDRDNFFGGRPANFQCNVMLPSEPAKLRWDIADFPAAKLIGNPTSGIVFAVGAKRSARFSIVVHAATRSGQTLSEPLVVELAVPKTLGSALAPVGKASDGCN
jgi:hypothetical protein